ncbi:MAG: hypothetical protein JWP01_3302 [Myxococcales bacterium]|nr:hypothetical protein [Myxococcales bacterium]
MQRLRGVFGAVAGIELEVTVTESPWGKDGALRSLPLRVVRFDEHVAGSAYVTVGLTAPGSFQKNVGGAPYEIALCLPAPTAWAPRMLAQLAQLSVGYELTHISDWTWTNLTKCSDSMGTSISIPRALREPYDGLGFVAYRAPGAPAEAPRVRLAVGVEAHERGLTEARFVGALKRYGFWPVTPATRDNVVDLAGRYVPRRAAKQKVKQEPETDEARALVEWLVEMGELVVADGAIDRVADRLRTRYGNLVRRYAEDYVAEAAGIILATLERDPDVEEVLVGEPARRELENRLAKGIKRANRGR